MILRQEADRLVAVRQVDHAHLSGELAAAWGAAPWDPPRPLAEVVSGARRHDDAWTEWDEDPEFRDGRPLAFFEVDRVTTTLLYAAGVDRLAADEPYEALLASLHYSGFFSSHWGWVPFSTPDRFAEPQQGALRRFVAAERERQAGLRRRLGLGPEADRGLEVNYKWLQLWDRVSLDICRNSAEEPWAIDYPAVPCDYGPGEAVVLRFAMIAAGRYTLNPYPLTRAPFRAVIPAVALWPRPHAGSDAFRDAPRVTLAATIEPV